MKHFLKLVALFLCCSHLSAQEIICPDSVNVKIQDFDVNLDYGTPVVNVTGPFTLSYEVLVADYTCDSPYLETHTKVWTVDYGTNFQESCEQVINVLRDSFDDYEAPEDIELANVDPYNLDINVTGYYGNPDNSGTIISSYTDQVLTAGPGDYKVLREWKLINWCNGEQISAFQIIKVFSAITSGTLSVKTEDGNNIGGYTFELLDAQGNQIDISDCDSNSNAVDAINCVYNNNPSIGTIELVLHKNTDHINGVSTLDLVLILKHILGVTVLDSDWKILAADVNNDGSITAIDLIEMRKLILGIYTELPNKESWTFYNENTLDDLRFNSLQLPLGELKIIGVKTGDVNGSSIP